MRWPYSASGRAEHLLVDQAADDLAVLEDERHLARAHFQHRARRPARRRRHSRSRDRRSPHNARGIRRPADRTAPSRRRSPAAPAPPPSRRGCRTRRDRGSGCRRRAPRSAPRIRRPRSRRGGRHRPRRCGAWRDSRRSRPAPAPERSTLTRDAVGEIGVVDIDQPLARHAARRVRRHRALASPRAEADLRQPRALAQQHRKRLRADLGIERAVIAGADHVEARACRRRSRG